MKVRSVGTFQLLLVLVSAFAPGEAGAEVTNVVITQCTDVLGGRPFGATGAYEKCVGRISFALDPARERNRNIADLDLAPKNRAGMVEFYSDIFILRPKDPSRGNGVVFFDVVNRGGKLLLSRFNMAQGATDPTTEAEFGDGFLMEEGYTLVAVGWEGSPNNPAVALYPPVASDNGKPITGTVSNWFVPDLAGPSFQLTSAYWTAMRAYPPLDRNDPNYRLTVRLGFHGEPKEVPRESWEFGRMVDGRVIFDHEYVHLWTGFMPGYTYEIAYETKDPRVNGVGFAAIRDAASYFKNDPEAVVRARFAYAYGTSQTGRYLRQMIHEGFTIDEEERKALDGIMVNTGGASLGTFNERWGQPNDGGFHTTSKFPFLYQSTRDPATGRVDGLGSRIPSGLEPKIFLVETASEYWDRGRVAALNHTSLDGLQDVAPAQNVRFFVFGSFPHGGGPFPARAETYPLALRENPIDTRPGARALLTAMDRWVREGIEPPASQHPSLAAGTLVEQSKLRFPPIPGVEWPVDVPGGYRPDLPGPMTANPLPFLVSDIDEDGNERDGFLMPDVMVPLATYTGWAFRHPRTGAPSELRAMAGSYVPFPRTREERMRTGDPRMSIEERYGTRAEYLRRVEEATRQLIAERLLLQRDFDFVLGRAADHWDLLMDQDLQ